MKVDVERLLIENTKSQNKENMIVLRNVMTKVTNELKSKSNKKTKDELTESALKKEYKELQEELKDCRPERVEPVKVQLAYLKTILPKEMLDSKAVEIVVAILLNQGDRSKGMGNMKIVMNALKEQGLTINSKVVANCVKTFIEQVQ